MALVESVISAQMLALIKASKETDGEKAQKLFCDNLAKVIVAAIKSGTVTIPSGTPVQVVPATGTGSTVAPSTGIIT